MTPPIRIDAAQLTLAEHAEAADTLAAAGYPADTPGNNFRQVAAMAWIVMRRTDPEYTLDQALGLHMADLEIVNSPPEASGGNGAMPPLSPEPGT